MTITLPAIVGSARDVGLVSRRSVMGRLVAGNYLIDGELHRMRPGTNPLHSRPCDPQLALLNAHGLLAELTPEAIWPINERY